MKTNRISLQLFPLILAGILAPISGGRAATINWTNTAGGNWGTAANWSPNQVPGANDTANVTMPGTYSVTVNVAANANSLTLGGAASGVQTLQSSGPTLIATNATISSGGVLTLTSSTLYGAIVVANGAVLSVSGSTLNAQVTVESGGEFLVFGSGVNIGEPGQASDTNNWLWVQSGGLVNAASSAPVDLWSVMTNAGVVNVTNQGINIRNNGTSGYNGGLVNQAGGVLNLISTAGIGGYYGFEYLVNQGTINVTNGNSTINVANLTNAGTVATLPGTGTLQIGTFNGLGSLTGTYNAAAGTIIQFVGGNNPGISAGTPLVLGGAGQYQFVSGLLTLPTNVIPGLTAMTGGNLVLGAGFQGGAITNLALDGISLSNSLPITGMLTMTNGTLATTNTITNGTVVSLTGVTLYGAITVANGAVLSVSGSTLNAQVTVESGGEFLVFGSGVNIGQPGQASDTNNWLWVQSGGLVNAASSAPVDLWSVMTNAGVVNLTNQGVNIRNNGTSGYNGGLVNQAGGVLNLISTAGIGGYYGFEYLVNQGTINVTNGNSTINVANLTNAGTVATLPGTGTLQIGTFNGLGSLTGTYNAAAGTIIQFVGGNNPGISAGTPLVLGGAGQYQFVSGLLTLPTNVIPGLTAMTGGNLVLGAGFQGGAITNLALDGISLSNSLPITGMLTMTNGTLATTNTITNGTVVSLTGVTLYGAITVANGAVLSVSGSTLNAQVTVESGGEFLVFGSGVYIGEPGQASDTNNWLWVQSGGLVNAASSAPLDLWSVMTNAGVVNVTNQGINIRNNGTSGYNGGLVNQAGGVLNLISTAGIGGYYGFEYLVNQGTINVTNGNSTINVANLTNAGTVATLPGTGTLQIGTFNGLGSLTGTYNAAAGTIIQFVGGNNPGISAGTPLVLGGAGQYQFVSGLLTLPTNVIPGLTAMTGGNLVLGAGFQGGAITNLALDGISLSNSLPITGMLTMTNGTLATTNTITNGTVVSLTGVTLYGAITVANGAVLSVSSSALNAQVTVESGGEFLVLGSGVYIGEPGQASDTNNWLWVQSGGLVNAASSAPLDLWSVMTNAGVVNVTNQGINIRNNGTSGYNGGLVNQAGGVLNLISTAGIGGYYGFEYLVNQGTINVFSTNSTSTINVDNFTNLAALNALYGTLQLQGTHMVLEPSETLSVGLNSATEYGKFSISGNAALTGAFAVSLNNGYVPAVGSAFPVVGYGSFSGNFNGFSYHPPVVVWQPFYGSTLLTLVVQPSIALSGTNLAVNIDGAPGHQAILVTSTNLSVPLANWTPVATNTFDATSFLSFTNNLHPDQPHQFFTFELP